MGRGCSLGILACAVSVLAIACKGSEAAPQFAVAKNAEGSLLLAIKRDGGLRVFLQAPDAQDPAAKRITLQKMLSQVANTWNHTLEKHSLWPLKGELAIQPVATLAEAALVLDVMASKESQQRHLGTSAGSYSTLLKGGIQHIVLVESDVAQLRELGATAITLDGILMHEYGHALGLGDTYEAPDYQENIGRHRPSVMRGGGGARTGEFLSTPQEDDVAGLWTIVNGLFGTGPLDCPEGYVRYRSESTTSRVSAGFCVRREDAQMSGQPESGSSAPMVAGQGAQEPSAPWDSRSPEDIVAAWGLGKADCSLLASGYALVQVTSAKGVACGFSSQLAGATCYHVVGNSIYQERCPNGGVF